jgi:hypothetical protein
MLTGFERIWNNCIQKETQLVFREDIDGLNVMTMVILFHSVHIRGEWEEGRNH